MTHSVRQSNGDTKDQFWYSNLLTTITAQTLIIPGLKILGIHDVVILIILGSISMVSRIVDTIADEAWLFYAGMIMLGIKYRHPNLQNKFTIVTTWCSLSCYIHLGTIIDTLGMYSLSLCRGFISVCVPIGDIGKLLAFVSTLDGLSPIIMSQFYTFIWQVNSFELNGY